MQFIVHAFTPIQKAGERIIKIIKNKYSVDVELYKDIQETLFRFFK